MKQRSMVVSVVLTLLLCFGAFLGVIAANWHPILGLDLRGGLSVTYCPNAPHKSNVCASPGSVSSAKLDEVVSVLQDRVNGLGVGQPNIGVQGPDVVVQLPGVKDANHIEQVIGQTAQLFFRKVLCGAPAYVKSAPTTTTTSTTTTTTTSSTKTSTTSKSKSSTTSSSTSTTSTTLPPKAAKDGYVAPPVCPVTSTPSSSNTSPAAYPPLESYATNSGVQDADHQSSDVVLPYPNGPWPRVELGPVLANGTIISNAYPQDISTGWQVVFDLTGKGTTIFNSKIAGPNYHYLVANDLDGVVETAPQIDATSFAGSGEISGGGINAQTAGSLALLLKYGALPVGIHVLTSDSVSPSLGASSLHAGVLAGLLGLFLVMAYTIFYYRALGIVVVLGLVSTAALLYGIISWLGHSASLTLDLSGITGLIVSVGITVDSYVVYFERLKDEVRAGRSIRSSVDKGFRSAYRTIVSADAVSFIGALVLYLLSIGAVKGFALMLGISTLLDVFTAYFFTRPLVILLGRNRVFTDARGLGVARGLGAPAAEAGA